MALRECDLYDPISDAEYLEMMVHLIQLGIDI